MAHPHITNTGFTDDKIAVVHIVPGSKKLVFLLNGLDVAIVTIYLHGNLPFVLFVELQDTRVVHRICDIRSDSEYICQQAISMRGTGATVSAIV